ncbi:DUF4435 domain-containing protein [Vibrio cholerae]|uniref:DUF4435 domain-containing protein n=1 Tax=Vibrio cholerae TaxID=666 RepID=UPI001C30DFD2
MGLMLEADELLNEAIMSETPILIVEGIDDIRVYEDVSKNIGKEVVVYAAENIDGVSEGCRGVINCIEKIRNSANGIIVDRYVLGIIDRDTRCYRNEKPEDSAILLLNWYSMESHFITNEATGYIVRSITRATGNLLSKELIDSIHKTIQDHLFNLYLISLDALKGACDSNYESSVKYAMSIGEIKGRDLFKDVFMKEDELNKFALEMGIEKNWDNLLKVCKGKWIFIEYCNQLKEYVSNLKEMCEKGNISQCQFCITHTFGKCLYKTRSSYNEGQLQELIMNNVSLGDFNYLESRLLQLI